MYDTRARLSFDIDPKLKERLQSKLAWGDFKAIYSVLTEQLVVLMENHDPELVKAGILSKHVKLEQLIDLSKNKDETKSTKT